MTTRLDLRGSLAKFEWAQQHRRVLQRDIFAWAYLDHTPPVSFRREFDPDGHNVSFWTEDVRPPPHRWGLMVGDTLNGYRGSLDYLARELVIAGRQPEKKDSKVVQFPFSDKDRLHFLNVVCPFRLPGVSKRTRRRLSPYQPYRGRDRDHPSQALALLFDLSGREKHRELVATVIRPYVYRFRTGGGTRILISSPMEPGKPFESRTKVISVPLFPLGDYQPDVTVDFDAAEHVAIEDGPFLLPALSRIERVIGELIGEFI